MTYPSVVGEFKTIDLLAQGASISRFGDGELKLMCGQGYAREEPNGELALELRSVLSSTLKQLLVGIPTMDPKGPKYQNWCAHRQRFERVLPHRSLWVSAFITRPDSAPWIYTRDFAERFEALWAGKRVALVAEKTTKLVRVTSRRAREVKHVECPRYHAYGAIDELERQVVELKPEIALLSCGPTATCLAARLCRKGLQAIDIGSAGGFLARLLFA